MSGTSDPRTELHADEIIDGGRDVALTPGRTARFTYRVATEDRPRNAELRMQALRHHGRIEEWPAFVREVFARLYDEDGCRSLADEDRSAWGESAMGVLEQQPEWPELRAASMVSSSIAARATAELAAAVGEAMKLSSIEPNEDARRDPRAVLAEAAAITRLLEGAGADQDEIDLVQMEAEATAAKAVGLRRTLDKRVDAARLELRRGLRKVALKAAERAQVALAMEGLGFSREGAGSAEEVCPELADAVRTDPRMLAIIRLAGRMRDSVAGELAKADGRCDVVGVRPTGDLARLTPITRANLAAGGVRALATTRDILEHAAQGWEQRDLAPRTQGDVAVLIDRSGSMQGEREVQARAMGVAATAVMWRAGRRVVAGSFSAYGTWGTYDGKAVTLANAIPGDAASLGAAIKAICIRAGGGTDVDRAVAAAAKAMRDMPGGMREPDVLVLTDGHFPAVAAGVIEALGDARLFGVLMDVGEEEVAQHPEFDAMWNMQRGLSEADAAKVVAAMRKPRGKRRRAKALVTTTDTEMEIPF